MPLELVAWLGAHILNKAVLQKAVQAIGYAKGALFDVPAAQEQLRKRIAKLKCDVESLEVDDADVGYHKAVGELEGQLAAVYKSNLSPSAVVASRLTPQSALRDITSAHVLLNGALADFNARQGGTVLQACRDIADTLADIERLLQPLQNQMQRGFEALSKKLDSIGHSVNAGFTNLGGQVDAGFSKMDAGFSNMGGQVGAGFSQVDSSFSNLGGRMDAGFSNLGGQVDAGFSQVGSSFSHFGGEMHAGFATLNHGLNAGVSQLDQGLAGLRLGVDDAHVDIRIVKHMLVNKEIAALYGKQPRTAVTEALHCLVFEPLFQLASAAGQPESDACGVSSANQAAHWIKSADAAVTALHKLSRSCYASSLSQWFAAAGCVPVDALHEHFICDITDD